MIRSIIWAGILSVSLTTGAVGAEFSADMVMESTAGKNPGKVYFKNDNTSRTEVMGTIAIMKRPHIYQLFTETKKYVIQNMDDLKKKNPAMDAANLKEWIEKNQLQKVGSEKIQGYTCDVYEGEMKYDETTPPFPVKIWHTPKLGYPLRHESILPPPMGKVTMHLEHIRLGPQPASLFEIPAGYAEAKSVEEAMGLEGMPSLGSEKGDAPSREEMEKMMKETMKKMKQPEGHD